MNVDEFAAHGLWGTAEAALGTLAGVEARDDFAQVEQANRIRFATSQVLAHREPSDPALYSRFALDDVLTHISAIWTHLQAVEATGSQVDLDAAVVGAEHALQILGAFPVEVPKGGAVAAANRACVAFRESVESSMAEFVEANARLREELATQDSGHSAAVAAVDQRLAELTQGIPAELTSLRTQMATQNETFIASQTEREKQFSTWLAKEGENLTQSASGDLDKIRGHLADAQAAYVEIDQLRDETKKVAEIAAGDQVAHGYRAFSASRWKWAIAFYIVGFGLVIAGATVVFLAVLSIHPSSSVSWQFAALRLALAGSAVFGAVIAFRLGGRLLNESRVAKQFELELKAIGPLFPAEDEREHLIAVKRDLVNRSFGNAWTSDLVSGNQDTESGDLMSMVREVLKKVPNSS